MNMLKYTDKHTNLLNDVHSKLNCTRLARQSSVHDASEIAAVLNRARRLNRPVIAAGGRHAMGGQQFVSQGELIDTRPMNRILSFDQATGQICIEAGIQWPELMRGYLVLQAGVPADKQWGIRQKQTGADKLTIGGAVAANIHGRCLTSAPFSRDILNMRVMLASGEIVSCSRTENSELFSLVIGGYGLFGILLDLTLQLVPRQRVQRRVTIGRVDGLAQEFSKAIEGGALYGDFQFDIDPLSDNFLERGIFSCYFPTTERGAVPRGQRRLAKSHWQELLRLAHLDKTAAYNMFSEFYLATNGQQYWSDTHQLNIYLDDYHKSLDTQLDSGCLGSEMISELYVPLEYLPSFLADCRKLFRAHNTNLVYGTIRITERDEDAFLPWAPKATACIIFNLHVDHHALGISAVASTFEALIDLAIKYGGSFYLTYHNWYRQDQLLACYPQVTKFLALKKVYDPDFRLQSNWWRSLRCKLADKPI